MAANRNEWRSGCHFQLPEWVSGGARLGNLAVSQPSCFLRVAWQLGNGRVLQLNAISPSLSVESHAFHHQLSLRLGVKMLHRGSMTACMDIRHAFIRGPNQLTDAINQQLLGGQYVNGVYQVPCSKRDSYPPVTFVAGRYRLTLTWKQYIIMVSAKIAKTVESSGWHYDSKQFYFSLSERSPKTSNRNNHRLNSNGTAHVAAFSVCTLCQIRKKASLVETLFSLSVDACCILETRIQDLTLVVHLSHRDESAVLDWIPVTSHPCGLRLSGSSKIDERCNGKPCLSVELAYLPADCSSETGKGVCFRDLKTVPVNKNDGYNNFVG
ncbi:hypothetical protein T265_08627 [Opisthorchis viverrini]|uniref:Peptidase A1 domain-containing protein n=1 Tax=Opisthorchis viverrini TaxID=6198 RepID=A0A074ZJG1_OPIVI|nr:hypothetical protein T265_08627 [Opisthorchis viverrini]KER23505.1 hypothetical protein T265_08627 [Opisthorchis viverrini]